MQGVLARLQKELGITFIYVTHSQSEAFAMSDRVVIMNDGQIEQTGTPRQIYRNPETRFVAEFVGSNNILSGTVKDSGDTIVIDSQLGLFSCNKTNKPSPPVGSHVSFVISADLVNISTQPTGSLNELKCQFISEEFIGSVVTLLTESEHGSEFKIQKQQRELSELDIQPGSTLYINWDLAHAHLLPSIT
jgi:spermidine/putrescine transport system ATP-binding protein